MNLIYALAFAALLAIYLVAHAEEGGMSDGARALARRPPTRRSASRA